MEFNFKAIPFVRIVLPFIGGILACKFLGINCNTFYYLLPLTLLSVIFYAMKHRSDRQIYRRAFIVTSDVFIFLCAVFCCYHYSLLNSADNYGRFVGVEEVKWRGRVMDLPREKENFFRCRLKVEAIDIGEELKNTEGEVIVYFKKPFNVSQIAPGKVLLLQSRFNEIPAPLNPHEFDYREFMADKNIFYQVFTDSQHVKDTRIDPALSPALWGLAIKKAVIGAFKNSLLEADAAQLCMALLTGYDEEISPETINAFAHSGTLHVLSVSGLHTGILYGTLLFLFGVFDKHRKLRTIRVVTIILVLWAFAFITGFSPPVLRATLMLSLLVIGSSYFGYSSDNAMNIVAVSAFGILLFNPMLLFDHGFLLSYSAIIGIIYLAAPIQRWYSSKYSLANRVWSLCSVSIAAQISTLPLTLYLFHQFPLWFMLSNLVVIPLCAVLMFLAFLVVLKLSFAEPLINFGAKLVYGCVSLTNAKGTGYIDEIDFNGRDALYLSTLILLFAWFFSQKNFYTLRAALLLVLVWQVSSVFDAFAGKSHSSFAVYHINRDSGFELKNKHELIYLRPQKESDHNYHIRPNHSYYNYATTIEQGFDYVKGKEHGLLAIADENLLPILHVLRPDYLLVRNGVEMNESVLARAGVKLLIADGSNTYKQLKELKDLCSKFGIAFYSTREKGYLELDLNRK